ncbi:TetR family transcriptional regulator [Streptomyces sp. SR27]|uniref:TetR family transcriptional regulator n=1 Tax=unclassified Streptomyces TaxID=2593676 RepID=UPI00295B79E4|nr:TetR family transcriptional regulator [Streptomyces sp. SR27]MDV9193615.1 TetR family transcriptional regulator [Streptomyces sp. SR27]
MTYDLVLGAAAAEFSLHGFAGTNLADITARTGLTKGALYGHFSSKADLAGELTRSFTSGWADALATATDEAKGKEGTEADAEGGTEEGRALPALRRLLVGLSRRAYEDPPFAAGLRLVMDAARAEGTSPAHLDDLCAVVALLIRKGQEEGSVSDAHPAGLLAQLVVALLVGAPAVVTATDATAGPAEFVREVWDLLEPSLSDTPRPARG